MSEEEILSPIDALEVLAQGNILLATPAHTLTGILVGWEEHKPTILQGEVWERYPDLSQREPSGTYVIAPPEFGQVLPFTYVNNQNSTLQIREFDMRSIIPVSFNLTLSDGTHFKIYQRRNPRIKVDYHFQKVFIEEYNVMIGDRFANFKPDV